MSVWDVCGDISNVIATGLAALSIYLSCKEHKNLQENEKNRMLLQQELLWYNEVVLNDIIKQLDKCIGNLEAKLEVLKEENEKTVFEKKLKDAYDLFKEDFEILSEKLFSLKVFDRQLYNQCDDGIQKICDKYSDAINNSIAAKRIMFYSKQEIHREKIKIVEALYAHGKNYMS